MSAWGECSVPALARYYFAASDGSGGAAAMRLKVLGNGDGISALLPIAWLQRSNHQGAGATEGEG
jgi:hypothetical protein